MVKRKPVFLSMLLCIAVSVSAQQWKLIGFKGHRVAGIIIQYNTALVGTDSGLYARIPVDTWYRVPLDSSPDMPIRDMKVSSGSQAVICAGNGSENDAVFWGAPYIGPIPYYKTKIIGRFKNVQSVAAVTSKKGAGDTIYAGGGNSVKMSVRQDSTKPYGSFQKIGMPPSSFGVEMPFCAALLCWSFDNGLFAGGYDKSPNPAPGHLLFQRYDSLSIEKQLNVTAIAEGELGDVVRHTVFFATKDSGFYYTDAASSMPPRFYFESPGDEPINDFVIVPGTIAKPARFYVAVNSGVYTNGSGLPWIKIGNLPAAPLCLFYKTKNNSSADSLLFAGTTDGLYVLDVPVLTQQHPVVPLQDFVTVQKRENGHCVITFFVNNPGVVNIGLFDCTGRRLKTMISGPAAPGVRTIPVPMADGYSKRAGRRVYLIRLQSDGFDCVRKILF